MRRYIWQLISLALMLLWAHTLWMNAQLREQNALLKRLDVVTMQWCDGVKQVNDLCEGAFIEILQRLGLDNEMMPLVTTALWKRATKGYSVKRARREMGAQEVAEGFLDKDAAMGGPDERDEQ